eukprot:scaffold241720_cov24-Tisochrysis_lutea.AAC.2
MDLHTLTKLLRWSSTFGASSKWSALCWELSVSCVLGALCDLMMISGEHPAFQDMIVMLHIGLRPS